MVEGDKTDFRTVLGGLRSRDVPVSAPAQCSRPYPSNVEVWAVYSAAYAALDRWVVDDERPTAVDRIQVTQAPPPPQFASLVRDADGLAVGGIRLPRVAVPKATNTGENQPASCVLFGSHAPFEAAELRKRYSSQKAFERQVRSVVDDLVRRRLILKEDAGTLIRNAASEN